MARRDGMQAVELVERDLAQDDPHDRRAARRRPSPRWLAVAGLAVVALVGTQLVVAARERAAVAALAQVSGVVRPVGDDLGVLWTAGPGVEGVLRSGIVADGTFVGLQQLEDNAQALVAVDERTGARRWTTPLADAHDVDHGDDGFGPIGGCVAEPGQTGRAACLVTDAFLTYRDTASVYVPSTTSRLVVVNLGDGSVVADRPAPSVASFTVLPGLVVTAVPGADGGAVLTAADLVTGDERWQTPVPAPPATDTAVDRGFSDGSTSMFATADGLGVVLAGRRITLLDPHGDVVRSGLDANVGYSADPGNVTVAAYTLDDQGSQSTTIVGGGPDLVLPGRQVDVGADDGSVPGVVLMADTTIRAYDRATGDVRWTVRHVIAGNALVLRGRVYLSTGGGVVAVDGRSGEELWRAPAAPGLTLDGLVTDGRHLLSSQQRPEEAGDVRSPDDWPGVGVLAAYRFEDGAEDWRVDLPPGLLGVGTVGRSLVGWGSATAVLG